MRTASYIRRHIFRLEAGALFTTRDMLAYGRRASVDQALYRLVRKGAIVRLARGVFARNHLDFKPPSIKVVAWTKALAFGKRIAEHGASIAHKLGLHNENFHCAFYVSASSSSFRYGEVKIHLRKACPRKILLQATRCAEACVALWHMGKARCNAGLVQKAVKDFSRQDRLEIRHLAPWLPAWLSRYFLYFPLVPDQDRSYSPKSRLMPYLVSAA